MKNHLRVTVLLAATIFGLSVLFFSPGTSSRGGNYYQPALRPSANAAKRPHASRGSSSGQKAPDYAKTLNKSLKINSGEPPRFSFNASDVPAPVQEAKLAPDVVKMVGPFSQDEDLRKLAYVPPTVSKEEERPLRRHPFELGAGNQLKQDPIQAVKELMFPASMQNPLFTFDGVDSNLSGCGCLPPDSDGDVGPNHYINSVNSSIRIYDKTGNVLAGPTTYNSFFSAIGPGNPCGNNVNQGDGIVFYDHLADRWVVSDFAFPAFPGTSFWQCVGVSKTSDPVAGGWYLYAVQVDPANTNFLGDYPKFTLARCLLPIDE